MMAAMNIGKRPAVGNNMPGKSPLAAQNILQEQFAGAAWLIQRAVIGAHHSLNLGLRDQLLESRQVGGIQIAAADLRVEAVTKFLRPAVNGIMLGAGSSFQVLWVIALQAAHKRSAHFAGQERVFTPGFLAAPPARIAENIDIRRPKGQSLVEVWFPLFSQGLMILGAAFVADGRGDGFHQLRVPGGRHADGLRENRGAAIAADTMQPLVPKVVGRDAQARHTIDRVNKLPEFFFQASDVTVNPEHVQERVDRD